MSPAVTTMVGYVTQYNFAWVTDGVTKSIVDFNINELFPGLGTQVLEIGTYYPIKSQSFGTKAIILVSGIFFPLGGLYEITSLTNSRRIYVTHNGVDSIICDFLIRGDVVYVLSIIQHDRVVFTNIVSRSTDLTNWEMICRYLRTTARMPARLRRLMGTFISRVVLITVSLPKRTLH